MEEEVEKIRNKMKTAPDEALADCQSLKKGISDLIKQAEQRRKEEEALRKAKEEVEKIVPKELIEANIEKIVFIAS
jgi:hypothetical protein